MSTRGGCVALAVGSAVVALSAAWGQALPSSAKVDTAPLDLTDPGRYQVPAVLEPIRQVKLLAIADGIVRTQEAKAGAAVREGQEVAQLDRGEAAARLKIAQAEAKEAKAEADAAAKAVVAETAKVVAQARLEAAQARAELAQIAYDRCSLRSPFAGKVMVSHASDGQYVPKGGVIAELADVSSLKALVPVPRAGATVGAPVTVSVEGEPVAGKIQALLPLPERQDALRELAAPYTAAWVVVSNTTGTLEPGMRAYGPDLPVAPLADIPAHALKGEEKTKSAKAAEPPAGGVVQVIRNEYVTDIKVRVIGKVGPDKLQVSGSFRPTDALIVSSTVPLLPGTLIRFNGSGPSGGIEGTNPNPSQAGMAADVTPPRNGVAPIGAPGSAIPKGRVTPRAPTSGSTPTKAATKPGGNVPF